MQRICEYIGPNGIVSSSSEYGRLSTPKAGDPIEYKKGKFGLIEQIHEEDKTMSICLEPYHPFQSDKGGLSMSGGPFERVAFADVAPLMALRPVTFWNWGANGVPRGGGACEYTFMRPAFTLFERVKEQETDSI